MLPITVAPPDKPAMRTVLFSALTKCSTTWIGMSPWAICPAAELSSRIISVVASVVGPSALPTLVAEVMVPMPFAINPPALMVRSAPTIPATKRVTA